MFTPNFNIEDIKSCTQLTKRSGLQKGSQETLVVNACLNLADSDKAS